MGFLFMNYLSILRQYFGFSAFRGIQKEIVESIGSGHDTLGLMPTGGGKSITFQVPALAMEGVCLVITPLIALMKDQVQHLRDRGILASVIYSGMSHAEVLQVLDNAVYGGVKFLYVSPERLSSPLFIAKIRQMRICFITVDEAHCISQWGYDFRPSYLHIAEIRNILEPQEDPALPPKYTIPVLALTATATPQVVDDIQERLTFSEKRVVRMSFKRENLIYVVRHTDNKETELIHILNSVQGSAIVYTRSRQNTKDVAKILSSNGISATFYHAGLDFAVKDQRQQDWQKDEVRVMVATNAFGMGIDKPDVRVVVHMDCPDSLEAYFQEAGRGGRDGNRAYAVLLYSRSDRRNLLTHVQSAFPEEDYIRKVYDDLSYFFQLALYDGEGARYEFNIERFCQVFKHFPTRLSGALSVLQRAGYIEYDSDPENHPRCQFLLPRDGLYQLRGLSANEDTVMTALLRIYCGLFSDLVYIEEARIADYSHLSVDVVRVVLKSLASRHILKYIPRRNVPIIYYPQQRIESSRLVFPRAIYEELQERMVARVDSVLEYAESDDECRSTVLLRYLGEKTETDCGYCDVCVEKKRNGSSVSTSHEDAVQVIADAINAAGGSLPIAQIHSLPLTKHQLDVALEQLRSEGRLVIKGSKVVLINE